MLTFVVDGRPIAWARARGDGAKRFTSPEQRAAKRRVAYLARVARASARPAWESDHEFLLTLTFIRRRKVSATPDVDNYAKLVMDACNGILWDDDAQIVALFAQKVDSRETELAGSERTIITVQRWAGGHRLDHDATEEE